MISTPHMSFKQEPLVIAGARFLQARCSYSHPANSVRAQKDAVAHPPFCYVIIIIVDG